MNPTNGTKSKMFIVASSLFAITMTSVLFMVNEDKLDIHHDELKTSVVHEEKIVDKISVKKNKVEVRQKEDIEELTIDYSINEDYEYEALSAPAHTPKMEIVEFEVQAPEIEEGYSEPEIKVEEISTSIAMPIITPSNEDVVVLNEIPKEVESTENEKISESKEEKDRDRDRRDKRKDNDNIKAKNNDKDDRDDDRDDDRNVDKKEKRNKLKDRIKKRSDKDDDRDDDREKKRTKTKKNKKSKNR